MKQQFKWFLVGASIVLISACSQDVKNEELVDTIKPIITLNGDNPTTIIQQGTYNEFGATAIDNVDGNLTERIEIGGAVDTNSVGTYSITYSVTDSAGNEAMEVRTVNVIAIKSDRNTFVVKKTGQTKSYDTNSNEITDGSLKDDGYYQKGIDHNATRDDVTKIVTDHVTGLIWQDDDEAMSITKRWITQENYNASRFTDQSGDTAKTYCENLALGGYSDWRLPTRKELVSIVDYGKLYPSVQKPFSNVASTGYWTSNGFIVVFIYGSSISGFNLNITNHIRCVRND